MDCALAAAAGQTLRRAPRVLVAEDHPVNRLLARRLLEKLGFEAAVAADGAVALSMWRADPGEFDLILMDIQMPNLDGLETARLIRSDETRRSDLCRHTPIVALTAHAMVGDEELCLAAGMDAYLSKPIEVARLKSTLQRFLAVEGRDAARRRIR